MCIKGRAAPWAYGLIKAKRPARAKALIINAFALTGRIVFGGFLPQGVALGYVLLPLLLYLHSQRRRGKSPSIHKELLNLRDV